MTEALQVNKPTPIIAEEKLIQFDSTSDARETIYAMKDGSAVLITEFYSNGMLLLKELHKHLKNRLPNKTFSEQRAYRSEYYRLSNQIFLEIDNQQVVVKKAPKIGWIEKLYPNNSKFLLTFPQVQGLNSAWQWYKNGILVPVLRNKIHPYYGTYFPTRFDHLILFDNWLKRYKGPKKSVIDVGIGSGVLSFQMIQHGFQKVFGTDINPNAIVGLQDFMGDTKLARKIELDQANLFGRFEKETELIVFNPPWLPAASNIGSLDDAIYYSKNLFPKFFAEANNRLTKDGKVVIIFSNLAQITNVSKEHPIEKELSKGVRFQLENCFKKAVKVASDKTKRDQHWRGTEEVELWVLTKK
jgi:16S rRNA G966 N2-methylase RsmD